MRVLYASSGYSVHDLRFISAYVAAGHEVGHVTFGGPEYEQRPLPAGARHVGDAGVAAEAAVAPFAAIAAGFAPDVVHAGPVPTCAWVAARAESAPLISMSWGSDLLRDVALDKTAWARAADALAASSAFQCDCQAVEDVAVGEFAFPAEKVVRFPWGVDLSRFAAPADARHERDEIIVISNRTWEPLYGICTVLQAFADAQGRDPRLRLLLGGSGSLEPEVHAFISEHALTDAVRVAGRIPNDELTRLLHSADIYLSCSRSDGSSISLLEAMATGLPAVVSDIPGNREWIEPGEGGMLAGVDEAAEFADALVALAANARLRERMGEHNRLVATERADWPHNVRLLVEAAETLAR